MLTLALLTVLVFPLCRDSWREKGSHAVRLVVVTALAATPLILLGLMFAGYFYTTLRLASRWIDSLYLFFLWNIVYLTAARRRRGGAASGLPARAGAAAKRGEGGGRRRRAGGGGAAVGARSDQPAVAAPDHSGAVCYLRQRLLRHLVGSGDGHRLPRQYHAVALHQHRGGQQRVAGGDAGQHDGGDRRGDRRLRAHPQPARFTGGGGAVAAAAAAGGILCHHHRAHLPDHRRGRGGCAGIAGRLLGTNCNGWPPV